MLRVGMYLDLTTSCNSPRTHQQRSCLAKLVLIRCGGLVCQAVSHWI